MGWTAKETAIYRAKKKAKRDLLPKIECACGCGELIPILTALGKPAKYKWGHNPSGETTRFKKGDKPWNNGLKVGLVYPAWNKGKPMPRETIVKMIETKKNNHNGKCSNKSGWKHKPLTVLLMTKRLIERDFRGEKNPVYIDGRSKIKYGDEWCKELRESIKKRDGWKCVGCGAGTHQARLVVHHIDADKKNNTPDNLMTLCKSCHGRLHGKVLQNIRAQRGLV